MSNLLGILLTCIRYYSFTAVAMMAADSLVENLFWFIRMVAYLEQEMNSCERLDELIQTKPEAAHHIPGYEVPAYWPSDLGSIQVDDLTLRYAPDLPIVLNATFSVGPKQKVGVVGRTGSGK